MPRRKKEPDRVAIRARISEKANTDLVIIVRSLGYQYGEGAAYGAFLEAIASGELMVVQRKILNPLTHN